MIEDLVSKAGRQPGALAAVGQQQGEGGRGDPVETGAKGGEQFSLYHDSKITS